VLTDTTGYRVPRIDNSIRETNIYVNHWPSRTKNTEKVMSRFHWNLVLWLGLPFGRNS